MAKQSKPAEQAKKMPPAMSPEARENQLISLAVDLAEQQLRDGTASSQVISHYLKLASCKERIQLEILKQEKELVKAKTENLKSQKRTEELYEEALNAMRSYSGQETNGDDEYE